MLHFLFAQVASAAALSVFTLFGPTDACIDLIAALRYSKSPMASSHAEVTFGTFSFTICHRGSAFFAP